MEYKCDYCNKLYSSRQSRWNHVKNYHKIVTTENTQLPPQKSTKNHRNCGTNFQCEFCNRNYSRLDSLNRHLKNTCKLKDNNDVKQNIISEQSKQIEELKELLLKAMKIHPKTLNKINNQLNNINNGTINNTNNTINIIPLGYENLNDVLTDKEKLRILNKRGNGLKEIVDLVHISDKYKQFKNVYITNLQNTIGYKFDKKNNQFIAVNKSELLDDLIDCRMLDIEQFYDNFDDKLDPETSKIVKRFIDRMNNNDDELKGIKKEELKLFLYNSREKIKKVNDLEI